MAKNEGGGGGGGGVSFPHLIFTVDGYPKRGEK